VGSYDLVVLGAGSAGIAAAEIARGAGWTVLVVEGREVGGTCPLRGCVPKKVLVAAAETLDHIARARAHGIQVGPVMLDWPALIARTKTFVDGVPAAMASALEKRGIDLLHGRARFVDPRAIDVDGRRIAARKILVSTGSVPRPLGIPGADHAVTSDDILELPQRPESVVFVGGGVIAFEFTHVFARAGTKVTILEMGPRILPALETEVVGRLAAATRDLGVEIRTGVAVDAIERVDGSFRVRFRHAGAAQELVAACVANGAGRVADVERLDLEAAGIAHEGPDVRLDPYLRSTTNPDVFFAGDAVANTPQLSALATYEGRIVGHNVTHPEPIAPDYDPIPSAVFTIPALATVGLTEERARAAGHAVAVKTNDMREWRSARTYAAPVAFAKVLIDEASGQVVGAHLLGDGAPETIHAFAFAMRLRLPATELAEAVYVYPTFHADLRHLV